MQTYKSVDEYIKKADKDKQDILKDLRALVKKVVPSATESIAYGMPAYSFKDKSLFYFAAMKGHLGLYPTASPIKACKDALKDFSTSKGCVRVPYKDVLPKKLVTMLLKERVREIKG
jgi:uncharacterized protein YdhG (YjbR/CyaY superfamily)